MTLVRVDADKHTAIECSIADRFRQQVVRHPARPAIASIDVSLTYAELDHAANGVAQHLMRRVDARGQRVLLVANQGINAAIATLAILKAGAAYVPPDPANPPGECARILALVEPVMILAERDHLDFARRVAGRDVDVACIDEARRHPCAVDPLVDVSADAIAYIYFTSGSTGAPKGVYDCHRNVLHNVWRYTFNLGIAPGDRLTLLQAPHFSGAVSSFFCAVLNGASCHPYDLRRMGFGPLPEWLRSHAITIFHSVPAIFREIFGRGPFPDLRCIRLEGDRASARDIELFKRKAAPGAILANGLGATECGLVRQWRIDAAEPTPSGAVPIGVAVDDMQVDIVDEAGNKLPCAEVGEIVVRSRYLALGYWRDPERTAARFSVDPSDGHTRSYRTGDMGRLLANDVIEYCGRTDFNEKVNGQRVDTFAVEQALSRLAEIVQAAVIIQSSECEEAQVVAHVVLEPGHVLDIAYVRERLSDLLPAAAIPTTWSVLERLPVDENCKVDRRQLPRAERAATPTFAQSAATILEARLTAVCRDVLGCDSLGVHDDLFELGADSLALMRINSRLWTLGGRELPLEALFACPTVAHILDELRRRA